MWCAWCLRELAAEEDTQDHVFPAAIGGTRELALVSCRDCQKSLRRAEEELARRSEFAVMRAQREFQPRNLKRDPASGAIKATYVLRRIENDGHAEVVIQGGRPIGLPSIEVNLATLQARTRGFAVDIERLATALAAAVNGPISYYFLDEHEDDELAAESDFWPRVYLDLSGDLGVRARTRAEGESLLNLVLTAARQGVFRREEFRRNTEPRLVPPGATHLFRIEWDERLVLRVITKVAYGVAFDQAGREVMRQDPLRRVRSYILGDEEGALTREVYGAGELREWPEHHLVAIRTTAGRVTGIVSLYGACHIVDLGPAPVEDPWQVTSGARCGRWGGGVQRLDAHEAQQVWAVLAGYVSGPPTA